MIQYSLGFKEPKNGCWGEICFGTDNEEFFNDVMKYIRNCTDAITYRNSVVEIPKRRL